jgi:hypothetical protein
MRVRAFHLILTIALFVACGDKEDASRKPSPATVDGLGAIPGEAKIVVGVNVAKLAESTLAKRTIRRLLAEDPALASRVEALLDGCGLDPARDLETVHVGIVEDGASYVLVARGAFDETRIVECVRKSIAASNGVLEARMVANAPAYVAKDGAGADKAWLAFGAPNVLILAGSEAWITKARDPAAAKVTAQGDMMGLIHRTDTAKALWLAGRVPGPIGKGVVEVTSGIVKAAPTGAWGHFQAGSGGLDLELNVEMTSDEDAYGLSEFGKKQLENIVLIAQTQGLGPKAAKIRLSATGKVAHMSLKLSASELGELEAQLDKGKEGATP